MWEKFNHPRLSADIPNQKQHHQFSYPRLNVGQTSFAENGGKYCAANMFFTENII